MPKRQLPEGATVKIKHLRRVVEWHADADSELKTPYEIRQAGLTPEVYGGRTEALIETMMVARLKESRSAATWITTTARSDA